MVTYEDVPVITYKEVLKEKKKMKKAVSSYKHTYLEYLAYILQNVGMYEKTVCCKQLEMRGMIKIVPDNFYSQSRPYKFEFYPFKKDGTLSRNSRYVGNCFSKFCFVDPLEKSKYEQILEALKENFSVIKEENQ